MNNNKMKSALTATVSRVKGFTLTELMITVAIIGVLASIAYPSYTEHVIRSDRAEALSELIRVANLQEQFFVDNRQYTNNLSQLGLVLETTFTTRSGYYTIASVVNNNTFVLTATALGKQVSDTDCTSITISETGNKAPQICWGN